MKWIEDRAEHLVATNHSRQQRRRLAGAFAADGELLALRDTVWHDNGAYVRTHGVVVAELTLSMLPGPYRVARLRGPRARRGDEQDAVRDVPRAGPLRGDVRARAPPRRRRGRARDRPPRAAPAQPADRRRPAAPPRPPRPRPPGRDRRRRLRRGCSTRRSSAPATRTGRARRPRRASGAGRSAPASRTSSRRAAAAASSARGWRSARTAA